MLIYRLIGSGSAIKAGSGLSRLILPKKKLFEVKVSVFDEKSKYT